MNKLVIIGGGGHASVLLSLIRSHGAYEIAGIIDDGLDKGAERHGLAVLGGEEMLPGLLAEGVTHACIGIGSISVRASLFGRLKVMGYKIPALVHTSAVVAVGASLNEGVQVMAGCILQPGVAVGVNTIINTGAVIDHDCVIGAHAHIGPGAVLAGRSSVGDGSIVGAGAALASGTRVGAGAFVGVGTSVIGDVPDGARHERGPTG
ncbi:MAG: NeuD/PglB/VioB family sugar acetyltransferase [Nitrospirae bacterium]|nr:NeuD/PglB/VioB family sugar acetyltransferase [Nitrospirota bacterium]MBI5694784.1 NeuD/PglB/VioB family sugar acetyltransferase [Nitrospirota bacterium]